LGRGGGFLMLKKQVSDSYADGKWHAKSQSPLPWEIQLAWSFSYLAQSRVDRAYWLGLIRGYREDN
jgi:hypothetical protein